MKSPSSATATAEAARPAVKELLIATVGLSPQVVTLALDGLLRRGVPIRRVLVVQPSEALEGIKKSLSRLRAEVPYYREQHNIEFEFCIFEGEDGYRPTDTLNKRDAEVVLQTLNREIRKAKDAGCRVHLSIAGGRKVISAFGTVAAQLHFDADDCCWHVVEGMQADREAMQADREAMHPTPGKPAILVDVPILSWKLWKRVIAGSLSLALSEDPLQTEMMLRYLEENVGRAEHLRDFFQQKLNYNEQRVLALLALEGLENAELETRLGCSVKNPLTNILAKYADFSSPGREVTRARLVADFQQVMLALRFQNKLPDLTPAGARNKPRKTAPRKATPTTTPSQTTPSKARRSSSL